MAGLGLGLGAGLGSPSAGGGGVAANPNLLLWTEEFDNLIWAKVGASISADDTAGPITGNTADLINYSVPFGTVAQVNSVAATLGSGVHLDILDIDTFWTRYEISGIFDGAAYVFSVYLKATDERIGGRLRLQRSGGLLACSVEDIGDVGSYWACCAQLELGATATTYVRRSGS